MSEWFDDITKASFDHFRYNEFFPVLKFAIKEEYKNKYVRLLSCSTILYQAPTNRRGSSAFSHKFSSYNRRRCLRESWCSRMPFEPQWWARSYLNFANTVNWLTLRTYFSVFSSHLFKSIWRSVSDALLQCMKRKIKTNGNGAALFAVSANVTTSLRKLHSINRRYDYALITFYMLYKNGAEICNGKVWGNCYGNWDVQFLI